MVPSPYQKPGNSLSDPLKIKEVNEILLQIAPQLDKLVVKLRECNMHQFEIMVGNGTDKLAWSDGKMVSSSPTQEQLTIELTNLLDQQYPPFNGLTFMSMIWNPNRAIAEKMAGIIAEFRKRDRSQVESQIIALLAAFKQGV